ncbi:MAG: sugar phosphate isomerase/epimerase [Acidobacteriota bacterium]
MPTRRDFHKIAGAALVTTLPASSLLLAKPNSVVRGVQIGAQSYSFRTMPLDGAIKAMADIGLSECELYQGHVEPSGMKRDEIRKWRETVDLDHFRKIAAKFKNAGIKLYAYNYSFRPDFTDAELQRGFDMAKALGVKYITASSTVPMGEKLFPYCEKNGIAVAFHGHSRMTEGEFASPESFAKAMEGRSKWIKINLDIGHFWAAGFDPVEFLDKHHADIVTIHIKDRKKNQGDNMPFGEGDTPIGPVLHMLRDKKYKIPANIEYEYKGAADPQTEVAKCYQYCRKLLEA